MVYWVSKTLQLSSGFWACLQKTCVSRGVGVSPDAEDLHPQHHQGYLAAMNLSLFLQMLMLFQAMLDSAC